MKKLLILLSVLVVPLSALWAAQSEDYLVMNAKGYFIRADPLNVYLSHVCRNERVEKYVNEFCTPNWPNYTRHWEIVGDQLYLVKIETNKGETYSFNELFYKYQGGPVWAKWFTGILSHRLGNSPVIHLNHDYYEEEMVVRVVKGVVIETFLENHKERWISYSNRLLGYEYPLAYSNRKLFDGSSKQPAGWMNEFLSEIFAIATYPPEKPSKYYPLPQIELNANLDAFQLKKAHRELSCYELLLVIAEETDTVLDITISDLIVTYIIRERASS